MDVNLSLVQILLQDFWKQFMDSSQQRMLSYRLVQMQLLKTVYGRFPTTDAALLLIQLQDFWKQFAGSPSKRMLTYRLFSFFSKPLKTVYRFLPTTDVNLLLVQTPQFRDGPKLGHLHDIPFQMASLSPFPHPLLWQVQISGHSSVQSPFTLESRKANLPI